MNKPLLYVAVSASVALLQASVLPALSKQAAPSVWMKLSGTSVSSKRPEVKAAKPAAVSPATYLSSAQAVAAQSLNKQAMFLFKAKSTGSQAAYEPAAALTIHPALTSAAAQICQKQKPVLVAMKDIPAGSLTSQPDLQIKLKAAGGGEQLIAQLSPDQIIAQSGGTAATPIPPVVSGTVDLEEFKPSNVIDLKISQSRTFKLKNKIIRTSISDPSIAEPIVVSENQIVLLGKSAGGATLVVWDDAGNSVAVDVRVTRDYSSLQAAIREIDPRIIVEPFNVGGTDRVILMGDVDHPESVIRAFTAANTFMDDRGMKIIAANSRIIGERIGEMGMGASMQQGQQTSVLSSLSQVDNYTFFSNANNNISRAQMIASDGGRVTSLIRVRKNPLIVLHVTFLEMNTAAARELGSQLGLNFTNQSFSFGVGGSNSIGNPVLVSTPGLNGNNGANGGLIGFPFPIGSITPAYGGMPSTGSFPYGLSTTTISPSGGGTFLENTGFTPATPLPMGFIQQQPVQAPGFGATQSPVAFGAASMIPTLYGNQAVSSIGQGILGTPPALLGQTFLFGAPGGASFSGTNLGNTFTSTSNFNSGNVARWSINPALQGIISHSRSRVLAEPTLVTVSGERAAFLAGGEIPVPQASPQQGATAGTVAFQPFGLRINMIPVLLENGTINLEVAPEERIISNQISLQFQGSTTPIPGFTTRKTQTIVELKPGQELFISGLVSANSGRELTKTPLLGEVPVLGALYRSKAFTKNESELIVAVRPEIILPGNPGQMKLPEEISKTEGPRDTNMLQVEPTIVDERYMTSGRAEHAQRIPGTLPQGAPIPDTQ